MPTTEVNIVHETETQRRHARVKLPARLIIKDINDTSTSLEVIDLSASGFGVKIDLNGLTMGHHYSGELLFKLNTIEFRLPIKFSVVYCLAAEQTAGCEFDTMSQEQISILRLFISKYLAGDLTKASDILTTMSRENFTKARKHSGAEALSGWRKIRALTGTGLAACIGLIALGYILSNLYQNFYVTRAVTALVDVERESVQAPADGYFELLADTNEPVQAGLPLAIISSPVSEYIKQKGSGSLAAEDIEALLPGQLNSLVKSPCDGQIFETMVNNNSYARKGDLLFDLIRTNSKPYITAIFNYPDADDLIIGNIVSLQFPGESARFKGEITGLKVDLKERLNAVIVTIQPEQVLPLDKIEMPVHVTISSGLESFSFFHSALAVEK